MVPCTFGSITVRSAHLGDLPVICRLMAPPVARRELRARSEGEMWDLLPQSFLAEVEGRAVGFAALEVYSQKLSEIQCLSYEQSALAAEIIAALLHVCFGQAHEHHITEVMAVAPPRLESTLTTCGFYVILPGQKKAMFIRTGRGSSGRSRTTPQLPPPARVPGKRVPRRRHSAGLHRRCNERGPVPHAVRCTRRASAAQRGRTPHAPAPRLRGRRQGTHRRLHRAGNDPEKLAEVQCVSVEEAYRGQGIGRRLIALCVDRARQLHIAETMAITAREEVLRSCGFDDRLPGAKIALFVRNR